MAGDLKHRIGRGVEDGLAAAHVLLAQLIEDLGAGRVTVAQKTWQLGATDQRLQQLGRKAVLVSGEVAPIEEHGRARHLPVARRGILARGDLLGIAIGGLRHHAGIEPGRELATGPGAGVGQTQAGKIGDLQRSLALDIGATGGALGGDMAQGVGPDIAEAIGIGRRTNAQRVEHQNKGTFHDCFSWDWPSVSISPIRMRR